MRMPISIPKSVLWLVPALVCLVLSFVPLINVLAITVLLFTPLLALSVNVAFVSLGVEACVGGISRVWLLFPAIWFAGYTALAVDSHLEVDRIAHELSAANADQHISFDRTRQELVVASDGPYARHLTVGQLLYNFDLPVVFQRTQTGNIAYRLGGQDTCQRLLNDKSARAYAVEFSQIRGADPAFPWKPLDDLCLYAVEEAPTRPVVTVQVIGNQVDDQRAPRTEYEIKVTDGSGKDHILRSAELSELLPLPRLSLTQNSSGGLFVVPQGPPFSRYPVKLVGAEGADPTVSMNASIVAQSLNLKVARAISRRAAVNAHADTGFDKLVSDRADNAVALLASLLATPPAYLYPTELGEVAKLVEQLKKLAPYAHSIVDSVITWLDIDDRWQTVAVLMHLVAALPDKEFSFAGRKLVRVLGSQSPRQYKPVSGMLLLRFEISGQTHLHT